MTKFDWSRFEIAVMGASAVCAVLGCFALVMFTFPHSPASEEAKPIWYNAEEGDANWRGTASINGAGVVVTNNQDSWGVVHDAGVTWVGAEGDLTGVDDFTWNKGGNIIFKSGIGGNLPDGGRALSGDIIFELGDREVIRLKASGEFLVEGKQVATDRELYKAVRLFFLEGKVSP